MKIKQHIVHFTVLLILLVLGSLLFVYENGNHAAQLTIGIVTSISYVVWGIVHHAIRGDLHRKVVVEYILIGTIAIIMFFIVLSP